MGKKLYKKQEKGITLIALIITIIVLIILAMVSINALFGDDGIMNRASQAKIENEKGEITDVLGLAVSNIKLERAVNQDGYENYFGTKELFIEKGQISPDSHVIVDEEGKQYTYNAEEGMVHLFIYKVGGTGTEFEFEIDINNEKITCKNQTQTNYYGTNGNQQQGQENTEGAVSRLDDVEEDVTVSNNIDAGFYACDNSGNPINGFDNWFDKDLSTYVERNTDETVKIKWNQDISGRQLKVVDSWESGTYFYVKYLDTNGNVINAYKPDGTTTSVANYNRGESVTYVPEGAVALVVKDYEWDHIYEIQLVEDGKYKNNYISNIKAFGVTANKIGLKWSQDTSVQKVKIYQDGIYIGESSNSEFVISRGLMNNTNYIFYLEPITDETTNYLKVEKNRILLKTKKDTAGFYFANLNETSSKRYTNWLDGNTETFVDKNDDEKIKIKWTENIVGKQIYIKTNGTANDRFFFIKFIDDSNNTVYALRPNGSSTGLLNYNNGESTVYVPEGATGLLLSDYEYEHIYDISVLEDGAYWTNHITNVGAVNIDKHSLNLTWDTTAEVTKTKIYQDGAYIGETESTVFQIEGGLLSNTQYTYTLEPITEYTVNGARNVKTSATFTTISDGVDFHIDGTNNITKKYYKNWFDADLSTYFSNYSDYTYRVTWSGDITGKQIYVKTNRNYSNDYFYVKYVNANGNVINSVAPDGSIKSGINYANGESATFVPEGAVALIIKDYEDEHFYEIGMFEQGKYLEEKITNVRATNVEPRSISLSWNKSNDVIKTKVYQDGMLLGETTDTTYTINSRLISGTDYIYYLEPIVEEPSNDRNMKSFIKVKTASDGADFYINGTNNNSNKYYINWFDLDTSTYRDYYEGTLFIIKWKENITGKKISITSTGAYNDRYYYARFKDANGNTISSRRVDNNASTSYINYQTGESIVYAPEGADYIELQDFEPGYFTDIKIVE